MSSAFRTVETAKNKSGALFRLMERNGKFSVFKLCRNYCGQARGGIAAVWRYVALDVSETEARAIFNRRFKGTSK